MRALAVLALVTTAAALQAAHPEVLPGPQTDPPLNTVCTTEDVTHKFKGTVLLRLEVDARGKPHDVTAVRKLRKDLDKAAVEAVQKWTFNPYKRNGKPVAVLISVEVSSTAAR
jgi:TonB family protein